MVQWSDRAILRNEANLDGGAGSSSHGKDVARRQVVPARVPCRWLSQFRRFWAKVCDGGRAAVPSCRPN
jgi:hypothetical protein